MTVYDRDILVQRLNEDLIGPVKEDEVLTSRPSDVYLSGILWPKYTRISEEEDESLSLSSDSVDEGDGSQDGDEEEISRSQMNRPSTAGISFAVDSNGNEPVLSVKLTFAVYNPITGDAADNFQGEKSSKQRSAVKWQRHQIVIEKPDLAVGPLSESKINLEQDGAPSDVYLHRRIAPWNKKWLITLTIVNGYETEIWDRNVMEQHTLFQVRIEVRSNNNTYLVARPSRNMDLSEDVDREECSTALLYRKALEYAVGHTCSAEWEKDTPGIARMVATTWIPRVQVSATKSSGHSIFDMLVRKEGRQPLSSKWLSYASDGELSKALSEIPAAYGKWIELQQGKLDSLGEAHHKQAIHNLLNCQIVKERMMEGAIKIGKDGKMAEAFRLANKAMDLQYGWSAQQRKQRSLSWRPFQLGFILLNISSIADRHHHYRNTMDLLWFPTGGGKTEAYLGLIAFLAFYRRLSANNDPDSGAGVAAIMRYTLRLLTTQQFIRASSVILACEAIRRGATGESERSSDLGAKPFSIGLWVGGAATPNTYEDAVKGLQGSSISPTPAQLINCPSCGKLLKWYNQDATKSIHVRCENKKCVLYAGETPLPVYTVDTDIYHMLPTLLIGTVDKFAQIPRKKEINSLFSIHSGYPPDLIVQDELHLISGPLGTLVGLYEVAIDGMFTRDKSIPKIIGSTATIRRANDQVRSLFNREVCQFPPPAIDEDDSGFAVQDPWAPGRLYVGITTAGRSAKFTLQAVASSLLQSCSSDLIKEGLDNYWTMVSYFNSLRELGGAVVLMQDDVCDSIAQLAKKRNESPRIVNPPEELTSRRTQSEMRIMLDRLAITFDKEGSLDIVLATNMLSVGVDIPRLGLMVVNGQPKGISEYIQATSRVGRGNVPGLIVAVLNNAKPRDRSHYESFTSWHGTLYRDVEASSVTPFAPRARDRGLHAILFSMVRHLVPGMLADPPILRAEAGIPIENVINYIVERSRSIDPEEETKVAYELKGLLEWWYDFRPQYYWQTHEPRKSLMQDADRVAALKAIGRYEEGAKPTMNNLRSIEPSTRFRLVERLKIPDNESDYIGQ